MIFHGKFADKRQFAQIERKISEKSVPIRELIIQRAIIKPRSH